MRVRGDRSAVAAWLFDQDPGAVIEARVVKPRRSLDQNALYWELLGQLAHVLRMGNDELHRRMVEDYGPYTVVSVRDDVPLGEFFRYWKIVGHGEVNGNRFAHVRVHKGSSEMDTAEFSRLLDGIIAECEAQGIPTAREAVRA